MPRVISFEGRQLSFPDDATDDEIASALGGSAPAAATPPAVHPRSAEFATSPDGQAPAPSAPLLSRENKLGIQGAGQGLADLAGAPVDLTTAAINLGTQGINKAAGLVGLNPGIPRIEKPFLGSESIADVFGRAAQMVGYEPTPPAETLREKIIYNTNRFGANAAGTAGLVTKAAAAPEAARSVPGIIERLAAPYAETPARAVVGDVAASAGAGAATAAGDTFIPDSVRHSAFGPAIEMALGLGGAAGGAGAAGAARAGGRYAQSKFDNMTGRGVPENFPLNPATGQPFTAADIDAAARIVQEQASNPAVAAENIKNFYADLAPHESAPSLPTTGAASDDVGLAVMEKAARTRNSVPFLEHDQRVNTAARRQVEQVAPADAAPEPFLDRAASERDTANYRAQVTDDMAQRQADADVAHAEQYANRAEQVRQAQAAPVEAMRGRGPEASTRLDRQIVDNALTPAVERKNEAYGKVPDVAVSPEPLVNAAEDVKSGTANLPPNAQARVRPLSVLEDIDSYLVKDENGQPTGALKNTTYQTVEQLRPVIESEIAQARKDGLPPPYIDNLRKIGAAIDEISAKTPEAEAANQQFAEQFAPVFGRQSGAAYDFRQDFNVDQRGRTASPPSETAGRFIQPQAPENTASLQRIFDSMSNPREAQTAARDYLLADLAGKNVVDARTGVLRPNVLRKWAIDNTDNLNLVPGLRGQMDDLLTRAQKGERLAGDFADEVRSARQRAKITPTTVEKNALSDLAGADATNAVSGIFKSKNPAAAMDDILARIGNDEEARNGLKASVREYLIEKATTNAIGKTTDKSNPVSFAKLDELFKAHEDVLAKVLSPEEMNALRRAHKMLGAGKNLDTNATAGSNTVEKANDTMRMLEAGLKLHFGMLKGGGIMRSLKMVIDTLPSNVETANQIVGKIWFDPEVATHLLSRKVDAGGPGWNSKLFKLLGLEAAAREENR